MELMSTVQTRSTAGAVVDSLRHAIVRGVLKANQPLRQQEVAERLGVSVIPVREALMVLEGEGLVTIVPNRGAVVSSISDAEASEIYKIRIALERLALEQAIPLHTEADWRRAERILNEIDNVHDPVQWGDLNWEFHSVLYRPSQMPRVMTMLQNLNNNVARYFSIYDTLNYHDEPQMAHRAILAACMARDVAGASALLEEHLKTSVRYLRDYLKDGNGMN